MIDIGQRLRDNGVDCVGVLANLPRASWTWATRPLSFVKRIVVHYDGVAAPESYNELDRLISEAAYHREKDWGKGARGDGFMYHVSIARSGKVYWTRYLEEITWHCGDPNATAMAVKLDGGEGQIYTQAQANSLQKVLDVLTTKCPEFPAGRKDVYGHLEMTQFGGTATKCPDRFLPGVVAYRNGQSVTSAYGELVSRPATPDVPMPTPPVSAPAPNPAPVPQAQPVTVYRKVTLKAGVEGLRIRNDALPTAGVFGMIYSKGGGYPATFEVYQETKSGGGYTWLKRKDDNKYVAEIGITYL